MNVLLDLIRLEAAVEALERLLALDPEAWDAWKNDTSWLEDA